ncbi:MAG: ATP-binding cassette domain-containing protein [Chloroflexi bacterium]|nr:ATP-binding cassette domain-containing protein [Chloroflexota bacterium]
MERDDVILQVKSLKKYFPIEKGLLRRTVGYVKAVDDVSFAIAKGEVLGLVGESGCGKATLGRCILRAIDPSSGQVILRTHEGDAVDITLLDKKQLRALRKEMQLVFQDPFSSLSPRMTVLDIIGEPLWAQGARGKALESQVKELAALVGLNTGHLNRYPNAFSGGQRQRIGIARALATNPNLIVADEPVSALDVSIQAQILNLLQDLQEKLGLTYLFIAHDLSVVEHIADRVAVMYVGKIIELAETETLYLTPKHPYTEALLSAVPKPDPRLQDAQIILSGEVANPADPPSGCYFHPRCKYAKDRCKQESPELREVLPGHYVSCHFAEELELEGVSL